MATFTLPTVRANLQADRSVALGAVMVAAWAQFWEEIGKGEMPPAGVPDDERAEVMMQAALEQGTRPTAFIEIDELFGDLARDDRFRRAFLDARARLVSEGTHATLRHMVGRS